MRYLLLLPLILLLAVIIPTSAADANFNIVFVGDSITEGSIGSPYIAKLPILGNPWNQTYVNLVNSGVNGRSMRYFYEYQDGVDQYVIDQNPNILFVYLGLKDLGNGDLDSFETHYEWFLQSVHDNSDSNLKQIYLIQFSWAANMAANSYLLAPEFNSVINNLAVKYDLGVFDLWEITETQHKYFIDGVHPNDLGAEVIASKLHNETSDEINLYFNEFQDSTNSESDINFLTYIIPMILIVLSQNIIKRRKN